MISFGIIGFGKMGQIRVDVVKATSNARVKSVYDENTLPDGGIYKLARNADEIINDPDIDAVFICTPNYLNKSLTLQALEAGKHVFCEKPPAFNSQEVEEIMAEEKISGKKLMYGFNHRHHQSIRHMKKLIDS